MADDLAVNAEGLTQPGLRMQWHDEKGMEVLDFHNDAVVGTSVDVLLCEPFDFASGAGAARCTGLSPGVVVPFVSIPTLIRTKQAAGRSRYLDGIENLQWLQEDTRDE